MRTLAWGDELCGQVVTQESWAGGIVTRQRREWQLLCKNEIMPVTEPTFRAFLSAEHPIFPPKGFAGKTDAELWRAMVERDKTYILIKCSDEELIFVDDDGTISACIAEGDHEIELRDPQALILALQNAAVLQARLRSTT